MRIFIGMPVYTSLVHSEVVQDLFDLVLEAKNRGDELFVSFPSSPFLSLSRNLIMQKGLSSDWILMWDADIQVPTPKFLYKMIETAYKYEAALVGLAVRIKVHFDMTEFACAKKDIGGYTRLRTMPKEPIEVDVMGAGVSLLNCKWIKDNLEQPYYEFKDGKGVHGPTILPEDWRFCEKVKEKGGKIMVDPTIETIHYGIFGWHYQIQ